MSYKKLVSLFAVSALALGACADDTAEEPVTDDTEEVEDVDQAEETTETEGSSSRDLIEAAKNQSGDAFPEYGLTVTGTWTPDGNVVQHAPGEAAVVPVSIVSEHTEYNTYLLEDGVVAEVISDEEAPEFTVESPSADVEYVVGVSPEDLGEVGDEVAVEDFSRSEIIVFEEAEPVAEEAE